MRSLFVVPVIVAGLSALAGVAYASSDDSAAGNLGKGAVFDPSAPVTSAQVKMRDRDMEGRGDDEAGHHGDGLEHRNGSQDEAREGGMEDD